MPFRLLPPLTVFTGDVTACTRTTDRPASPEPSVTPHLLMGVRRRRRCRAPAPALLCWRAPEPCRGGNALPLVNFVHPGRTKSILFKEWNGALRGVPAGRGSGKPPAAGCSEGKAFPACHDNQDQLDVTSRADARSVSRFMS